MRVLLCGLGLLLGCRQLLGISEPSLQACTECSSADDCSAGLECVDQFCTAPGKPCTPPTDADPGAAVCAGSPNRLAGSICFDAVPASVSLEGTFDTTTDPRCNVVGTLDACIVVVEAVTGSVRVIGTRPLVLWSASSLVIGGSIDASSTSMLRGPNADPASCNLGAKGQFDGIQLTGAGGAGGSFGSPGGHGGDVSGSTALGGAGGLAASPALRGGCPGGAGGNDDGSIDGGHGGGALYVMARATIEVTGTINVSGGGGVSPGSQQGGGGGGSGGLVGFDAPAVSFGPSSVVIALGGGGSGGAGPAVTGFAGNVPTLVSPFEAATTASTIGCTGFGRGGGSGGAGLAGSAPAGCGGGGGGGGNGFVVVFGMLVNNGVLSPPPE